MTDNEIIKALECCNQEDMCDQCPYDFACYDEKYKSILSKDALDLIKRTKLESKRYRGKCSGQKVELTRLYEQVRQQKAEIEELQKRIVFWREDMDYHPERVRAEAIKEFAENNVCNMFNNLIKSAETYEQQQIVFLCKQRFVEMYMGVIKNLTHQPKKIEHNSLCETETYERR